jgi:predicted secreted protein
MTATAGVINSSDWIVQITEDSGSTYDTYGRCTNVDINWSMSPRDVTTKSSLGNREIEAGKMEASISFEGLVNFTAESDIDKPNDIFTLASARTQVGVRVGKLNTGDYVYTANGFFTSFGISGGVEDNVTNSIGFDVDGAVTQASYS